MMFKNRTLALFLSTTAAMFIAVPAASALTINMNIINNNNTNVIPAASLVGPAGGLGQTWNQFATTSANNLLDFAGVATAVDYTSGGTSWGGPDSWGNPALGVIRDGLRNFDTSTNNSQNLQIKSLTPGTLFDLYLVSANVLSSQRSQGEWTMLNPTSSPTVQTVDNTAAINGSTWVLGNNYVLFQNVAVDLNGEIRLTGKARRDNAFDTRLPLNGFQLVQVEVQAAIPEPATATLGLLSVAGLIMRRRRLA